MTTTHFPVPLSGTANTQLWADEWAIEPQAVNQLRNIARLPWVHGVRVMPDVHLGKGATVGSVIAMKDAVSPNAVGVDIGCGMIGVRTSLRAEDLPDSLAPLRAAFERAVPVGFSAHERPVQLHKLREVAPERGMHVNTSIGQQENGFWNRFANLSHGVQDRESRARHQLGTLGGGNHFIELCVDDEDRVWLQLHSGSRNIGKEIAERHINVAKGLDHNLGLPDRDLAVFLAGTAEMTAYVHDLRWAQEYAARSRDVMMRLVVDEMRKVFPHAMYEPAVNVHHNYVAWEQIDGQELVVTRKGAIRAGKGDLGLIPGSMGTGSFIVRGLGNPASYESASHAAGRRMSRGQAKRTFTVADLADQTRGVECRKDQGVVDEIPGAYKDLNAVIAAQLDLVEVVTRLRTLLCVKG